MKINYPFKKYDWVNCSERTEEEIQAMLERMWELGANKFETVVSFDRVNADSLGWWADGDTYFTTSYKESGSYNEVLWEDILPTISTEGLDEISKIDQEEGLYEEPSTIPPVTEWKCFEEVAKVLGEEDAEYELNLVRLKELENGDLDLDARNYLMYAFFWHMTNQGRCFWQSIYDGTLPESYTKQEESTKTSSQTLGGLVELLQVGLSPTSPSVSESPEGVFLHGEGFPTVDVTKLDSAVVDKLIEVFTEVKGCFVEFNGEGEGDA